MSDFYSIAEQPEGAAVTTAAKQKYALRKSAGGYVVSAKWCKMKVKGNKLYIKGPMKYSKKDMGSVLSGSKKGKTLKTYSVFRLSKKTQYFVFGYWGCSRLMKNRDDGWFGITKAKFAKLCKGKKNPYYIRVSKGHAVSVADGYVY